MQLLRPRLSIRVQLLLLFGLLLLTGTAILLLDEIHQQQTRQAHAALTDGSLSGLRRIMAVTDAYGRDVIDSAAQLRSGRMSWPEARGRIDDALLRSELHWQSLSQMPLTSQQRDVFAQADRARTAAAPVFEELQRVLQAEDGEALARLVDEALYPQLEPVTSRLHYLSDLMMIEAGEVVADDAVRGEWVSGARIGLGLFALLVIVVVGRALVRDVHQGIDSLLQLSQQMRQRNFDAEPRYLPRGELGEVVQAFLVMRTDVRKYAHELQVTLESNDEVRRWLQERDLFQRSLLSAAQTAILSIDPAGHYTHVNPFAEKLLGYRAAQLVGEKTPDLLHDPDELRSMAGELFGSAVGRADWRVFLTLAEQQQPAREWTLVRADGSRVPVLLGVSAMTSDRGELRGLLFVATDLTTIKQLEVELRASEARARRASRAKSVFLAAMSHEIRTPMIGVTGMVEVLSHTRLDEEQRRALNVIQHSADNLLQIIGDILDFSKIEAGRLELSTTAVSLRKLVAATVYNFMGSASSKGLHLGFEIDDAVAHAHRADALRLRQILGNFLSNAIKFTEHGTITVSLRALGDSEDGERQRIEFAVADTGIGVSAEAQARLFQPFTQAEADTTRRFGGTGLGLAICRRLAELMHGTVDMHSEEGVGTTMRLQLELPRAAVDDIEPSERFDQLGAPRLMPRRLPDADEAERERSLILLVDDHPTNRLVISRQLALIGFVCETADDGEQGLEKWISGRYALVLSDVHMPRMDGYEMTRAIRAIETREQRPRTPILAVTAAAMKGEAERCMAAGMDDYLVKPVGIDVLLDRLRKWLPHLQFSTPADAAAAPSTPLPQADKPPPLDPALLHDICGGDATTEREVLLDFMETTRHDLEQLQRLQSGGDGQEVGRQAHKIKGAARLVGAIELAEAAQSVETAGREGNLRDLHALGPDLMTAYERLRLHLAQRYPVEKSGAG